MRLPDRMVEECLDGGTSPLTEGFSRPGAVCTRSDADYGTVSKRKRHRWLCTDEGADVPHNRMRNPQPAGMVKIAALDAVSISGRAGSSRSIPG